MWAFLKNMFPRMIAVIGSHISQIKVCRASRCIPSPTFPVCFSDRRLIGMTFLASTSDQEPAWSMICLRTKLGAIGSHALVRTERPSVLPLRAPLLLPSLPHFLHYPSVSPSYRIPFKIGQPKKQIVPKTVSNSVLTP